MLQSIDRCLFASPDPDVRWKVFIIYCYMCVNFRFAGTPPFYWEPCDWCSWHTSNLTIRALKIQFFLECKIAVHHMSLYGYVTYSSPPPSPFWALSYDWSLLCYPKNPNNPLPKSALLPRALFELIATLLPILYHGETLFNIHSVFAKLLELKYTLAKVWENSKKSVETLACGSCSTAFLVLSNIHSCVC